MLITDQRQIAEAISQIIGEETYVSLRRTDFETIDALLPRTPHFKRGLSFVPEDGENEVWVFE